MKRRKTSTFHASRAGSAAAGAPAPNPARRWRFRLVALVLPLVLLGLVELALRLAGWGYPTAFFLLRQESGREVFVTNPDFTRRFFPPGLARTPEPISISAVKPAGVTRAFVFGESAALGDPEPAYGVSRILQALLEARYPSRKFEVVNVAITAINSHVIREIARDCANKQGDIWIIYMGNNEVVGPFGAGTVFSDQVPPRWLIRAQLAFKRTRLGQALDALKWRLLGSRQTPRTWEGMEMFLRQQVRQDNPRMPATYANFAANLRDIVQCGLASGARVIVSTVVSNLRDCPPFASAHRAGLSAEQRAQWDQLLTEGATNEAAGQLEAALNFYEQARRLDDSFAELQFRLGRCLLALGRDADARAALIGARDLDTLRFRADSAINETVARVTRDLEPHGARLADAATALAAQSAHILPGGEFLFEHVHLNFSGNYRLAVFLAESVATAIGGAPERGQWLSEAACAQRLAYTAFDRQLVLDEIARRLELPPFSNQLEHPQRMAALRAQAAAARATAVEQATNDLAVYRSAVERSADDWVLRARYGEWLGQHGDAAAAAEQWRKVTEIVPESPTGWYQLGTTLDAQGRFDEALDAFEKAARLQPHSAEPWIGQGLALANAGRPDAAQQKFEAALRRKPDSAEARVNLAQIIAQQGRVAEAEALYRTVIAADSNNVAAHINLGRMLAARKDFAGAIAQYEAALRARPDSPVAHYNLGNVLEAGGDARALAHYAAAVRFKPDFVEARNNFGLLLARQGRQAEALAQFAEVARFKPDFADGRLNYGVALARAGRFGEAVAQFEAALKLQPGNTTARRFLEEARARQ